MKDQRKLKAALVIRDEDIARLSAELSKREEKMQLLVDENAVLKKRAGVPEDWGLDPAELNLTRTIEHEKLRGLQQHYEERVRRLESER